MEKRIVIAYSFFIILATALLLRVYSLCFNPFLMESALTHSSFRLDVGKTRAMIYDCNMQRLVSEETKNIASVIPSKPTLDYLMQISPKETREKLTDRAKTNMPFLIELPYKNLEYENIFTFEAPNRYSSSQLCPHIIGYLDSNGDGVMGIESVYNDFLREDEEDIFVSYSKLVKPPFFKINKLNSPIDNPKGIVLTIDKDIQQIAERAMRGIKRGAGIVMDIKTGELKAVVSKPSFFPNNIENAISKNDGSLINRAFTPYSVGSSFKLLIALSALEQGLSPKTTFDCAGAMDVDGVNFCCHYKKGHGPTDMKKAIAWSCNPYFIKLGQQLDIAKTISLASEFGFGRESKLCEGIFSKKGILPTESELKTLPDIANFSFGQGRLLATPLQINMMTAIIANNGEKVFPRLVVGETSDGYSVKNQPQYPNSKKIVNEENAKIIKEMMVNAVENGSCINAKPRIYKAGGKTASAQTGQYVDGEEIVHAWFTGFYPAEKPKYAITILCEEGMIGGEVAAPVFAEICNKLIAAGKI